MPAIKRVVLAILFICTLIFTFIFVQRSRNPECQSPLILGYMYSHNQPEEIANGLITKLGGLPKTNMDIHEALKLLGSNTSIPVYPVKEWHILTSRARNPEYSGKVSTSALKSLFDSEPMYNHNFKMQVVYADGDTAVLQWSSWSYGIVACPILISMGSGPPGQLKVLP